MASRFENEDYRLAENADQIRFVMPRRPIPVIVLIVTYSQALSPIFFGSFAALALIREAWFVHHAPGTHPPSERFALTVAFGIWAFVLLLSYLVLASHVRRLGRAEVRLSKTGLESWESLWPVRFRRTRNLKSLLRLAVDASSATPSSKQPDAQTERRSDVEPAVLLAHFSDQNPLVLARMYPRSMLESLAKDLTSAAARLGSGQKVRFESAPPLAVAPPRAAVVKPLVVTSAPRGSKLVASEIAAGGVRISIPRNSPLAIACASLLMPALITLLLEVAGHAPWIRLINPKAEQADVLAFIAISAIAAVLFSFVLYRALAKRIFEANQTALYRSTQGPLGRLSKRWKQDDIASLDVVTRVHQGGRGGTRTVDTLELRLNGGRTVKLMGDLTKAELKWMGDLLSAALRLQ